MKNTLNAQRPETLDEVFGQDLIKNFLKKLISKREFISILFYGKPGTGKTSLAYSFCNDLNVTYSYFNAATGNKKELTQLISRNDYLVIDEIHRLNKDKQDLLLPAIEFGKVQIVATTTENPFFVVNPAVRSRMHIMEVKIMSIKEMSNALFKYIKLKKMVINISKRLLGNIVENSNGDYRYALNIVILLEKLYKNEKITEKIIKSISPSMHFYSDRKGDGHYNLLSAFHKSLRGSDENASLYYLVQLIESGDVLGIERRMIMVAYEDVGFANPNLALRVSTAIDNVKKVGFPEGRIILANAVIDIAKAPKSNSAYLAINNAQNILHQCFYEMPKHLKDDHYASASKLGNGIGYKYPHDYGGFVKQQYLPNEIKDKKFYKKNKNDKL